MIAFIVDTGNSKVGFGMGSCRFTSSLLRTARLSSTVPSKNVSKVECEIQLNLP